MKPYYERAGITIYHADCREIPQTWHDTVITDPVWPNASELLAGAERPYELLNEAAHHFYCRRLAIHLGCNSDPRILQGVPGSLPFFRAVWLRYARPHYLGRLLYGSDVAYLFGEPPSSKEGLHLIGGEVTDAKGKGKETLHPTPRKLAHTKWLVSRWSEPTDVILDPFAGSGTTLLAAKELGREAIGIEIEERYCEMAAERLSQEVMDLTA